MKNVISRNNLSKAITIISFLAISPWLFNLTNLAQNSVTGSFEGAIVDSETQTPISDAVVEFVNEATGWQTAGRTDSDGKFFKANLPPGVYRIKISASGYESIEKKQELYATRANRFLPLPITLVRLKTQNTSFPEQPAKLAQTRQKIDKKQMAAAVKREFLHAWNGYKKYAWGHDDLLPLTKSYKDWYGQTLLMTPVDALDTLYLLGFKEEADRTRKYITDNLSFEKDIYVQNFEITIRILGGLLSSYQMTGDKKLLALADDLGTRLLPVFESPTGIPYRYVNLKTGKVRGEVTNPAESGTLLVEFGTLSKLTKKPIYFEKAKRALVETYNRRSEIGLVGTRINVETGKWTNTASHISAEIDSFYEYLLKCALLFDDADCRRMWQESIAAINKYLADEVRGELWYGHAEMSDGKRTKTTYGALDAFFPAVLALSGDLERAKRLQDSSFKMWTKNGVEPEEFDYVKQEVTEASYHLRPEIVESTYYLYQYTADEKYLRMGKTFFDDFVKYCRTEAGYAVLKSVLTKEKSDTMHSFLFAETFKYYYLLFAPPKTLDFKGVVFNTEAHPVKKTW